MQPRHYLITANQIKPWLETACYHTIVVHVRTQMTHNTVVLVYVNVPFPNHTTASDEQKSDLTDQQGWAVGLLLVQRARTEYTP